uniref:ENTH domain-containing protein n=1 Tax=Rhabditophanes sp. KR3021 TaxID=114890 RepID=A0AC35TL62_9BILA
MSISTIRRQMKNVALNYSDAQIKVREATSNDPWGPTTALMSEIAEMSLNPMAFNEIMTMLFKRLNDHGKNWRHVYKSLVLLDYLIKCGSDRVPLQCREQLFSIETLKDFQHIEENRDQGMNVREKAKLIVALLQDEEKLKAERTKQQSTRRKLMHQNGMGLESSSSRPHAIAATTATASRIQLPSDIEYARPNSEGEEEMQLQLAIALSKEESEKDDELRKGYEARLKAALEESKSKTGQGSSRPTTDLLSDAFDSQPSNSVFGGSEQAGPASKPKNSSIMDDLLDLDFGPPVPNGPLLTQQQQAAMLQQQHQSVSLLDDPWGPTDHHPVIQPTATDFGTQNHFDLNFAPSTNTDPNPFDPWGDSNDITNTSHSSTLPTYAEVSHQPSAPAFEEDPWSIPSGNASNSNPQPSNQLISYPNLSEATSTSADPFAQFMSSNDAVKKQRVNVKTPETFLGEHASLVNMDNLMGVPSSSSKQGK